VDALVDQRASDGIRHHTESNVAELEVLTALAKQAGLSVNAPRSPAILMSAPMPSVNLRIYSVLTVHIAIINPPQKLNNNHLEDYFNCSY